MKDKQAMSKLKLIKFGSITENKDGNLVFKDFEFEGYETKILNSNGDEYAYDVIDLIIEKIQLARHD